MKKVSLILFSLLALTACQPSQQSVDYPILPEGLKDCKFFHISNGGAHSMQVARCPNSTTTTQYSSGKTQSTAVVIDGVEYVKK